MCLSDIEATVPRCGHLSGTLTLLDLIGSINTQSVSEG